jgi:hypothetical protein
VTTLAELYQFVGDLSGSLRASGGVTLATRLDKALAGTTSGEILNDLRIVLTDVINLRDDRSVREALSFIVSVLLPQ